MPKPLRHTTPIVNIIQVGGLDRWVSEYTAFESNLGYPRNLVKLHKLALGPQTMTVMGDSRLWCWQRPLWTVFVGNRRGICFEVPPEASPETAWLAWQDYLTAMKPALP